MKKIVLYLLIVVLFFNGSFSVAAESLIEQNEIVEESIQDSNQQVTSENKGEVSESPSIEIDESKKNLEESSDSNAGVTEEPVPEEPATEEPIPPDASESSTENLENEADTSISEEIKEDEEETVQLNETNAKDAVAPILEPAEEEIQGNESVNEEDQVITPFAVDIGLLGSTTLTVVPTNVGNRVRLKLTLTGSNLLGVSLPSATYSIFTVPPEIMTLITSNNLTASYNIPRLLIGRNEGEYTPAAINIDRSRNQIYLNNPGFPLLTLVSQFIFTLNITLDQLPPSRDQEYWFYAQTTGDPLINLSILEGEDVAPASIPAPQYPAPPIIDEPVYNSQTTLTGKGGANQKIILTINGQTYTTQTTAGGNYTVTIPLLEAGTVIRAVAQDARGYQSEETLATVVEPPDVTPPQPPIIYSVYSNRTVVEGTGEPNARVVLTINGTTYESIVNNQGTYQVTIPEQEAGTIISGVLIDPAGNTSGITETTVIEASLSFYSVPETLPFETTIIEAGVTTAFREDPDWTIEVSDTRGQGSGWRMTAEAETPLTNGNHVLPDALIYVDEQSNSYDLTQGPVEVFVGETGIDPITSVRWEPDEGPLIQLDPTEAYASEYQTSITWTLVDVP